MPIITASKLDFTKLLTKEQVQELVIKLTLKAQQILELDSELFQPFLAKSTIQECIVLYPLSMLLAKMLDSKLSPKESEALLDAGTDDIVTFALNQINLLLLAGVNVNIPVKEVSKLQLDVAYMDSLRKELEYTLDKIKEVYNPVSKTEIGLTTPVKAAIQEDKPLVEDPWADTITSNYTIKLGSTFKVYN